MTYVATWDYIGAMRAVGLRELKNHLSAYVKRVRRGDEVLVTDRGTVVAMLIKPRAAPRGGDVQASLEELARHQELRLGISNSADLYPRLQPLGKPGLAEKLLTAERGDS